MENCEDTGRTGNVREKEYAKTKKMQESLQSSRKQ